MDCSGRIADESDTLGCKITHDLIHPEMCIIGYEVGGNLNMSGDGYARGEKLLCNKYSGPQQKTSTRYKQFSLLPLVLLNGNPIIFVMIISGKKPDALVKMGINNSA